jgi:nitrate reductase assembly molybdenum cofactor insertion protein NarJ
MSATANASPGYLSQVSGNTSELFRGIRASFVGMAACADQQNNPYQHRTQELIAHLGMINGQPANRALS